MPHYTSNNILAVTYGELVPRFYSSEASLSVVIKRSQKRGFGIKKLCYGGNGRQALIAFDSLPEKVREQMDDPRVGRHVLEAFFAVDGEAVKFYQSFRFGDGRSISEDLQSLYVGNASVIQAVMKLKVARRNEILRMGHRPKNLWDTLHNDAMSFIYLAQKGEDGEIVYVDRDSQDGDKISVLERKFGCESDLPKNPMRFKEKCEKFTEEGYMCLISQKHGNDNSRRNDDAAQAVLKSLFAKQEQLGLKSDMKPTPKEVWDIYNAFLDGYVEVVNPDTGEAYDPTQYKKLSESTVRNFLSQWETRIATYNLRSGDRAKLKSWFRPSHELKMSDYAGSIVSVDDRQPPFKYKEGGTNATNRVWFYVGRDHASDIFYSWVHGKSKEGIILDFYRQMVRNCHEWGVGIPLELECESSLNSTLKDGLLLPGNMFEYVRIEANNPSGKFVEPRHKKERYEYEKHLEGWIPRVHAKSEPNQPGAKPVPLVPYERIVQQTLLNIQRHNNSEHPRYKGKSRWEVFLENQNPDIQPINWRGILPYIGNLTKTSCNRGEVKLQNNAYLLGDNGEIYFGNRLIDLLKLIEGEQVNVRWLDDNEGKMMKAYAFVGDQFVCELLRKPSYKRARAEQTDEDLRNRELMSKYVATVDAFCKRQKQAIERVVVIDNRPTVLNHKFQIPGLKNEVLGDDTINTGTPALSDGVPDVVVMPEPEEDEFNCELIGAETKFKQDTFPGGF